MTVAVGAVFGACGGGDGSEPPRADVSLDDVRSSLHEHGVECTVVDVATTETATERHYEKLLTLGGAMPVRLLDCGTTDFGGAQWQTHEQFVATNAASVAQVCAAGITEIPDDLTTITLAGDRTLVSAPHAQGVVAAAVADDTGLDTLDVELDCDRVETSS